MSGRVIKATQRTLKYFTNPLVEGKYKVIPPPAIPSHIKRPPYITSQTP